MEPWQERTALLIGEAALDALSKARVMVVGTGGVGGYAAEMLARSGVGHLVLIDSDTVSVSNKNRQIIALDSTIGELKCEALKSRLLDINKEIDVITVNLFLEPETIAAVIEQYRPDFVVDAIDTIAPKMALIKYCYEKRLPLVSSMGAGAKSDVTKVRIADISKTFNCSLAFVVRKRLKKIGITKGVKVVFSEELPDREAIVPCQERNKCSNVGSVSYLPPVFGCACAQAVISYFRNRIE